MLLINEVFHTNICFIYVFTKIVVIIFTLRKETHGRQHFNKNWHKNIHNNTKNTSTSTIISIVYPNITLQFLSLGT
jgi:c-di-AMP phosphodiesterase-like protein